MQSPHRRLTTLASIALAAALVSNAAAQPPASPPRTGHNCFWTRNIQNFAAVDRRNVYLRVSGRRVFQLTLFSDCLNLNWVNRLGLRARGSSNICEGRATAAEVFVRQAGGGGQRCPVTEVRMLSPEEVAALPPGARP